MRRRSFGLLILSIMLGASMTARADDIERLPVPEHGVVTGQVQEVPGNSCVADSHYEFASGAEWYGNDCRRLRIVFGPIAVKPGQNDVLIQPVTIEKPQYDGYMVRFKPSLIDASGYSPGVENLHLHHGTWLNPNYFGGNPLQNTPLAQTNPFRAYGAGPWLATGEEKTIAAWPKGTGLLIKHTDAWLFLHMVHSAVFQPQVVWVTYDVDYVGVNTPSGQTIKNTKGMWLDVGGGDFHAQTETYPANPVYNVMRNHGTYEPEAGRVTCSYPVQNCATYNSLGNASAQQGIDVSGQTGVNGLPLKGKDWTIPFGFLGGTAASPGKGTLVVMGGHLHTGGIRDDVSLVRPAYKLNAEGQTTNQINTAVTPEERLIHISDAYYWNAENPNAVGAPPTSWDFSMTGVSRDIGWSVNVQEGDILRLNALYDTELGAWWENMGIVMTWVLPGEQTGYDMFAKNPDGSYVVSVDRRIPQTVGDLGALPEGDPNALPGGYGCLPSATTLCARGQVTHGHYKAGDNHGSCEWAGNCPALQVAAQPGPLTNEITWGAFTFGESDKSMVLLNGIPRVRKGETLRFVNADMALYLPHTATSCAWPCTGFTTVDYPLSNGNYAVRSGTGFVAVDKVIDFDSSELAYGIGPAGRHDWEMSTADLDVGVYPYYCRIHPSMRGYFEVVPADTME